MKILSFFALPSLNVGSYELPTFPAVYEYAVEKLCRMIAYHNRIISSDGMPAAIKYDRSAEVIRVYRDLVGGLSEVDDIKKWVVICECLSMGNDGSFTASCSAYVKTAVRNFFSRERLSLSIQAAGDGWYKFRRKRPETKIDAIRGVMANAISYGEQVMECEARDMMTLRTRVSALQATFPNYSFSVSWGGNCALISAKKGPRADRAEVRALLQKIIGCTKGDEDIIEFDAAAAKLRGLLYGSGGSLEELI